ncbi:hypothetical protein EG19_07815, partial [Thermoanaerobaculum aquaticum]
FCEALNRKFAQEPAKREDWHRPVPQGMDLADIFGWEETRVVNNDWTVRYHNRWFQITGPKGSLPPAKKNVTVRRRLDGTAGGLCGDSWSFAAGQSTGRGGIEPAQTPSSGARSSLAALVATAPKSRNAKGQQHPARSVTSVNHNGETRAVEHVAPMEKPKAFPQVLGKRSAFPPCPTAPTTTMGSFLSSLLWGHF